MPRSFLPSPRQTNVLLIIGFLTIGWALYLRYLVIESSTVGLVCEAGIQTRLCLVRRSIIALFNYWVFGGAAMAAAVLNFIRPSIVLFAIGLASAGMGIVLYNVGLSALAIALLILSLARPLSETM